MKKFGTIVNKEWSDSCQIIAFLSIYWCHPTSTKRSINSYVGFASKFIIDSSFVEVSHFVIYFAQFIYVSSHLYQTSISDKEEILDAQLKLMPD